MFLKEWVGVQEKRPRDVFPDKIDKCVFLWEKEENHRILTACLNMKVLPLSRFNLMILNFSAKMLFSGSLFLWKLTYGNSLKSGRSLGKLKSKKMVNLFNISGKV